MKHLIQSSAALTSLAPLAQAAITFTTVDLDPISNTGNHIYVDFSSGQAISAADGGSSIDQDIEIEFENSDNSEKPAITTSGDYRVATTTNSRIARYNFGDDLNFTSLNGGVRYLESAGDGPWDGDTSGSIGYVAVQNTITSKDAWLAIDYDDASNTLDLVSFAFADTSDNMTAGAVPEPAETALLMVLAAGSVALYNHRRRNRKQPDSEQ